jgi:hypothetical protein
MRLFPLLLLIILSSCKKDVIDTNSNETNPLPTITDYFTLTGTALNDSFQSYHYLASTGDSIIEINSNGRVSISADNNHWDTLAYNFHEHTTNINERITSCSAIHPYLFVSTTSNIYRVNINTGNTIALFENLIISNISYTNNRLLYLCKSDITNQNTELLVSSDFGITWSKSRLGNDINNANELIIKNDSLFIATNVGIKVNPINSLPSDTWTTFYPGNNTESRIINSTTFIQDTLFAATYNGVYKTRDYTNWYKVNSNIYLHIQSSSNKLIASNGFLYYSNDYASNWTRLFSRNASNNIAIATRFTSHQESIWINGQGNCFAVAN